MARDFIYIDSDKVKETLKSALEMGEGDLSGNKLGLSSKVVPVVSLNSFDDVVIKTYSDADFTVNVPILVTPLGRMVKIHSVNIYQSNTETDAKNFNLWFESLSGDLIGYDGLVIANNSEDYVYLAMQAEYDLSLSVGAEITFGRFGCDIFGKNLKITQATADGTAQVIRVKVVYHQ